MSRYPRFLESELSELNPNECFFHIIPVPYEASVSYGGGTAKGPEAIISASSQLELWTGSANPSTLGIYTAPAVACVGKPNEVLARIGNATEFSLDNSPAGGCLPILLGGEHSITPGALAVLKERFGTFGVVHFDAHADLRNSYQDSTYSHACAMRRAADLGLPLFQLGVRSLSAEEVGFRKHANITHLDARALFDLGEKWAGSGDSGDAGASGLLPLDFPEQIFVSFDVDALDPSIVPATGTPEPGGLGWYQSLNLLEAACRGRKVIGADFVELAPKAGDSVSDFTIARLVYEFMGIVATQKGLNS